MQMQIITGRTVRQFHIEPRLEKHSKMTFKVQYTGSSVALESEKVLRLVQSVCDDVAFASSRGRIKPGKHLTMGHGMKSITGARKVIDILNRLGHSISDHTVEELETELATEITEKQCSTPMDCCSKLTSEWR